VEVWLTGLDVFEINVDVGLFVFWVNQCFSHLLRFFLQINLFDTTFRINFIFVSVAIDDLVSSDFLSLVSLTFGALALDC